MDPNHSARPPIPPDTLFAVKRDPSAWHWGEQWPLEVLRAKILAGEIAREALVRPASQTAGAPDQMTAGELIDHFPATHPNQPGTGDAVSIPDLPPPAVAAAAGLTDEALLQLVVARGESTATKGSNPGLLLVTGVLFLALGGLSWGWSMVVFLAVAIALHELGHVMAMRFFGYKNVRMLFIPLFGGLATGEPRELDATRNALVALSGPACGLLTALVAGLLAVQLDHPSWLVRFAWVALTLNVFNLLPMVPLDGGQFANETLFARFPVLELVFRLLAVAGLAWVAVKLQLWLLGLLAYFVLVSTPIVFRRARLICAARHDPEWQARALDLDTVIRLRGLVRKVFPTLAPQKLPVQVHLFWLELHKRFPGPGRTVALVLGYLVLCLAGIPALFLFFGRHVGRPLP